MRTRSILLLIAGVLGLAYAIYLVVYFAGVNESAEGVGEAIGAGLATAMVTPHMICTIIAVIFNILGWAMSKAGFALVAGILYAVAAVIFVTYAMFVVVQMILCFIGYARLHKNAA